MPKTGAVFFFFFFLAVCLVALWLCFHLCFLAVFLVALWLSFTLCFLAVFLVALWLCVFLKYSCFLEVFLVALWLSFPLYFLVVFLVALWLCFPPCSASLFLLFLGSSNSNSCDFYIPPPPFPPSICPRFSSAKNLLKLLISFISLIGIISTAMLRSFV